MTKTRDKRENPMTQGELTEEEYHQLIVLPNKAKARAKLDRISETRATNLKNQHKRKRDERAGMSLFEQYELEEPGFKLFDDD